jgi:IPT/TIG domain-containing protein
MRIDSILPNLASPGQSVIIQGDDLGAAKKILFGDQEVPFDVDGEVLVVEVPDGSGALDVTVEGADGESAVVSFTIA